MDLLKVKRVKERLSGSSGTYGSIYLQCEGLNLTKGYVPIKEVDIQYYRRYRCFIYDPPGYPVWMDQKVN